MPNNKKKIAAWIGTTITIIAIVVATTRFVMIRNKNKKVIDETRANIEQLNKDRENLDSVENIVNKAKEDAAKNDVNTINKNETNENNNGENNKNEIEPDEEQNTKPERKATNKKVVVIDPGHQTRGNSEKEPIGPGASETKAKVTGGATGISTGKTEYQLNLEVALKVRDILESKGYTVIMTRTTNNVNMSNSERAKIANEAGAAAFVRIHANSADSSSVNGVLTMCQTSSNKYNGDLYEESYRLSKCVLNNFVESTGAANKGVTKTDTMSGINWCTVPVTIVEMGFMSNPEEDELMATEEYQNKMANGIANGIIEYLEN